MATAVIEVFQAALGRDAKRARTSGAGGHVLNAAGGAGSFAVSDMTRAHRFLILGAEGGTYYASEPKLAIENAGAMARLIAAGRGVELVELIEGISVGGRAAKQGPTLFALAMCARLGDVECRRAAYAALGKVCRIPTHLFAFIGFAEVLGVGSGWGRMQRRAIAEWYGRDPKALAYAVTKYRNREGWTHRDVLRLAHVKPATPGQAAVFSYAVKGWDAAAAAELAGGDANAAAAVALLAAIEEARSADKPRLLQLIAEHRLAREHLPTEALADREVWEALLPAMGLTALIRNLGKMTNLGLIAPLSPATEVVVAKLGDAEELRRARVHPFSVLLALTQYKAGHGDKGSLTWTPVPAVVAALDQAFYNAFATVEPTGKRFVVAMDVSGSMTCGGINGARAITPRVGAAAMAMVTMRAEAKCHPLAFTDRLVPLAIDASMSLDQVVRACNSLPFGATDCAQPMLWALKNKVKADVFVVYTDCETWAGAVSPAEALRRYRKATGIPARLVVVAMTSGGFSLADPSDAGMLDVVGFDAAAPDVMRQFALGAI